MYKLNSLQYPNIQTTSLNESYSLEPLKNNDGFELLTNEFKKEFGYKSLNSFSFTKEGFLSLMIELDGSIAISKGECEAIKLAGKLYEKLGNKVSWIGLTQKGEINLKECENLRADYFFVSSYIIDTFVQTNLEKIKEITTSKLISNCSANKYAKFADMILFDAYKLCGYGTCGVVLYSGNELSEQYDGETDALGINLIYQALKNQNFESKNRDEFIEVLKEEFNDDLYFFVEPNITLPYNLHFGLKDIKAREIIRTLSLNDIYITNGEGCSLGLARPSQVIQDMGYEESKSRWALSLTFTKEYSSDEIKTIVKTMSRKYRQIKALS
jgi:cysteine sulfinate desulfinase/cysteine desulfurase-like protein